VADAVVIVKGKAQTREGETSLLAELVLTHFDKVVAIGEEPARYQPALALAAPTLNGVAAPAFNDVASENGRGHNGSGRNSDEVGGESWSAGSEGWDDFSAGSGSYAPFYSGEESPFRNDIPEWLDDGSRPAPLQVSAPAAATAPIAGNDEEADDAETDDLPPAEPVGAPVESPPLPVVTPAVSDVRAVAPSRRPAAGAAGETPGQGRAPNPAPDDAPQPAPAAAMPAAESPQEKPGAKEPAQPPAQAGETTETATEPAPGPARSSGGRRLIITFRRTGDVERDKYRLREIYEMVRDPRGRDSFTIKIESGGHAAELAFPNDGCNITKRLEGDLKRLKLEVVIQ
jgi:hypothetical protein